MFSGPHGNYTKPSPSLLVPPAKSPRMWNPELRMRNAKLHSLSSEPRTQRVFERSKRQQAGDTAYSAALRARLLLLVGAAHAVSGNKPGTPLTPLRCVRGSAGRPCGTFFLEQ